MDSNYENAIALRACGFDLTSYSGITNQEFAIIAYGKHIYKVSSYSGSVEALTQEANYPELKHKDVIEDYAIKFITLRDKLSYVWGLTQAETDEFILRERVIYWIRQSGMTTVKAAGRNKDLFWAWTGTMIYMTCKSHKSMEHWDEFVAGLIGVPFNPDISHAFNGHLI